MVLRPVASLLGHAEQNILKFISYIICVRNVFATVSKAAVTATNSPHNMNVMFIMLRIREVQYL